MSTTIEENKPVLIEEIQDVLKNEVSCRHSYFQLRYFLIGKEPTNQSKMWQCLRELKTRHESLSNLDLEREETKDRIELLDISIEKLEEDNPYLQDVKASIKNRETIIKIRQIQRQKTAAQASLSSLEERKKWLEEESRFFLETFKNIQKVEPLKSFDDLESQKQYWGEKLSQKLNLKMLTNNQLDSELIETIVALPDDVPLKKQTLATLNVRHSQMLKTMTETMKKLEEK